MNMNMDYLLDNYEDGIDLYICPECKEEYTIFEDMVECYKIHLHEKTR